MKYWLARVGCLVMALNLLGCSDDPQVETKEIVRPVKLYTVELDDIVVHQFPGEVQASDQAVLAFRVPGQIAKYHVLSGEQVEAGQLLVELDNTTYQLESDNAQAAYELAQVQHSRAKALVKDFLISQQDFDQSKADLLVAEANLDNAKSQVDYCRLYSPYNGVVANTYHENFEYVQAQLPVLSVHTDANVDVIVQVPERVFEIISRTRQANNDEKVESDIQVQFPAIPTETYKATVKEVSTVADPDTASFAVTLTLPDPGSINLYAGMSAAVTASLATGDRVRTPKLPENSTFEVEGKDYVWVVDSSTQRISQRQVSLNDEGGLVSGLKHGEVIVETGTQELKDGQVVKHWVKERGL